MRPGLIFNLLYRLTHPLQPLLQYLIHIGGITGNEFVSTAINAEPQLLLRKILKEKSCKVMFCVRFLH